jgi:hypothetical protein
MHEGVAESLRERVRNLRKQAERIRVASVSSHANVQQGNAE